MIASANDVKGCGGTFDMVRNIFTTAPATTSCTVTAAFTTATGNYYTVTANAGAGGAINPPGTMSVNAGATKTFIIIPNAGYRISSVGGCSGTWNGTNSYTTGAVTAPCTVTASFAQINYTVTAGVSGIGGTISSSGANSVPSGTTKAFTITPNPNYRIFSVNGCGGTLSGSTFTTAPVTADCTVTASFASTTTFYTVTATAGTGGTISPPGNVSVASGATQAFTVTANTGYIIDVNNVTGTCGGILITAYIVGHPYSLGTYTTNPVNANCTVSVSFRPEPTYYTITPSAGPGGSIDPSAPIRLSSVQGTPFTLTPDDGYKIASVGGTCVGTLNGNIYTVSKPTADCTIIALFAPTITYTITTSAGTGGTISPPGTISEIAPRTTKTFTVTPNLGYYISSIKGCDGVAVTGDKTFTSALSYTTGPITANCTVTAAFTQLSYTVTASASTGGTISPPGPISATYGTTKQFTATPNTGYYVDTISGCRGASVHGSRTSATALTYTTGNITDDCTVTASFAPITYTITVRADTNGTVSPSGNVTVGYGATQKITITPDAGFIASVSSSPCDGTLNNNVFTTKAIFADCTITVAFTRAPSIVTASAGTGGSINPSGAVSTKWGSSQTFTITPNPGYTVVEPVGGTCGASAFNGNTYITKAVLADCTVTVTFSPITYTVTTIAGTGGTISPPGPISTTYGTTKPFTITPNAGYYIATING
ncbi:MAG: hypothetical protein FWC42_08800, partial [Proteobacteria bacterium]|nr:hypothetical protein [Pseudomonadota bacterium]